MRLSFLYHNMHLSENSSSLSNVQVQSKHYYSIIVYPVMDLREGLPTGEIKLSANCPTATGCAEVSFTVDIISLLTL